MSSPPAVSDLDGGKRSGNLADFRDLVRLTQHFDVLHLTGPCVEPQDVPVQFRHLQSGLAYLTLTDKAPYLYARGRGQVRTGSRCSGSATASTEEAFASAPRCYTVINSNSPTAARHPDVHGTDRLRGRRAAVDRSRRSRSPARWRRSRSRAPSTLQHAEALAGIALTQVVRPGAPVVYGAFTSNVDMKSGRTGLRHAGVLQGGARERAARAPRGPPLPLLRPERVERPRRPGDVRDDDEPLRRRARRLQRPPPRRRLARGRADGVEGEVHPRRRGAPDAGRGVPAARRRRRRDRPRRDRGDARPAATSSAASTRSPATARPSTSRSSPTGRTSASGRRRASRDATQRANEIWKQVLAEFEPPPLDDAIAAELAEFVARRTAEGGAPPES